MFPNFLWPTLVVESTFRTVGCFLAQGAALGHLYAGTRRRPAAGITSNVTEHFPEPGGHEVVEDGVDGRAQVEEDSGHDVDGLEELEVLLGRGVDVAPHQAVYVEGSPAKAEYNHQHTWTDQMDS